MEDKVPEKNKARLEQIGLELDNVADKIIDSKTTVEEGSSEWEELNGKWEKLIDEKKRLEGI